MPPYVYCSICHRVTSDYSSKSAVEIHMVDCLAREFGYYVEKSPDVGTAWHLDIPGWNRGLCLDNDGSYYHLTADRPLRPPILTFNEFYALLKIFLRGAQTS